MKPPTNQQSRAQLPRCFRCLAGGSGLSRDEYAGVSLPPSFSSIELVVRNVSPTLSGNSASQPF